MKLRKYILNDIPIIHKELGCNPEMMRYTGWNPYVTILKAWSAQENPGSKRVLEKNGFVETGVQEKAIHVAGESYNQIFFEKTK